MHFINSKLEPYFEYCFTSIQNKLFRIVQSPVATILMLHRVEKRRHSNIPCFNSLIISPEFLENTIQWYMKNNYSFISISELLEELNIPKKSKNGKKIVISVDDGYKDTYENAFPIFMKYNVPFIFYVSSAFPNKKIPLWWNYLNDLITNNTRLVLKNGLILSCDTIEKKQKIYIYLSKEILKMGDNLTDSFNFLFNETITEVIEKYEHMLIDWQDIQDMSKNTICSVGAHTTNHLGLRYCDYKFLLKDIIENKVKIESVINKAVEHFAYPYGTHFSVGRRDHKIAQNAGFRTAVVAYSSDVFPYHRNELYCLPRVMLHEW